MSSKKAAPAPVKTTAASPAPKNTSAPAKTVSAPAKTTSGPAPVKATKDSTGAVPVPETVLKRRKIQEERRAEALKKAQELKKKRRVTRGVIFQRAEKYASQYRRIEQSLRKHKQLAKSHGNFFVEPEAKVALVIRIRGINGLAPKPRKVLQLLRLRQINNAAFFVSTLLPDSYLLWLSRTLLMVIPTSRPSENWFTREDLPKSMERDSPSLAMPSSNKT